MTSEMIQDNLITALTDATVSVYNMLDLAISLEDKLVEWNNMTNEELVAELELTNKMLEAIPRMCYENDSLEE